MQKGVLFIGLIIFGLLPALVFGATTGKISGKVVDDESGEGLPGVNIILRGWVNNAVVELDRPTGAATDDDGEYFIINLAPGRYVVTAKMIGYRQMQYTNVVVSVERTQVVNFRLRQEAIQGEEVSITAKREVVEVDVSASQLILSAEETENLPRNSIQEVLDLSPGVTVNNYDNTINIRGGGDDQVMSFLDGFAMKDNVFNRPFLSYNRTAIEEITIQTGGFQAEYGELRSGMLNVVTREGGKNYNLSLDWKYSPPGYRYDGPKKYLEDKYYLMYGSDWSMNEAILQEKFPNPEDKFIGWPKYSEEKLTDSDPYNDLTPEQQRKLWLWQHRGRAEGEKPDYVVDATFSGPFPGTHLPGVGQLMDKLSFMVSFRGNYTAYANPGYRDHFEEQNSMFKLNYNISPSTTLSLLGLFAREYGLGYLSAGTNYETPVIMRTGGGGSYVTQNSHLAESRMSNLGLHFEHVISPSTFLEFRLSRSSSSYEFDHGPARDTTKIYQIAADYYTLQAEKLEAPGYWNPKTGAYVQKDTTFYQGDRIWCPSTWWDETPDGWAYSGVTRNDDQVGLVDFDGVVNNFENSGGSTIILRGDLTSQVTKHHLLKTGFYYTESVLDRDYYQIRELAEEYTLESGEDLTTRYREVPRYGALYFQDRIEIKGLTGNFGFRGELFDANTKSFIPDDPFSNFWFIPNIWENLNRMEYEASKKYYRISPRFGISHPMTVNSKIYFNYGHAYTAPGNVYRYGLATHPRMWSNIKWRGNPDLEPPKTVQYSLGYEHVLLNQFLIHAEIFYKDVTDQLGTVSYQNVFSDNPTQRYYTWDNKMYEDIIGFEFRVNKRFGRFVTGWLQTEFRGQKAGEIGYAVRFVPEDPENVSEFSTYPWPDDFLWEWTPSFIANLDFHTPISWGPTVWGMQPLAGWRLNAIVNWAEGDKWTWNPDNSPFVHNNMQNANYFRSDFFISKDITTAGIETTFYLDIRNLFSRELLNWGVLSGPNDRPGKEQYEYLRSIEEGGGRVGHYKDDFIVRPDEKPGENYIYRVGGPIRYYFGLRFNFTR